MRDHHHQSTPEARGLVAPAPAKSKRWRVTIANGEDIRTIDSAAGRIRRCQSRVRAWASALPRDNRRVRRAGRRIKLGPRLVMLTLTYHDADEWRPGDIRQFMIDLRSSLGENLYGYAWVLEMQKRGAPHYHVLLYVKRGAKIERPDDRLWTHGLSRIETARSAFYISKYTGKAYQKHDLPAGARMFAVQIYKYSLSPAEMLPFRVSSAPEWLRPFLLEAAQLAGEVCWSRCKGGGWCVRETGEYLRSPWVVLSVEPIAGAFDSQPERM